VRPEAILELRYASQHGRVVHTKALGGSPHGASASDGKKVANVIPVDHGAILHRAVRLPKPLSNTSNSGTGGPPAYDNERGPMLIGGHRS
jgi:hypothetical protein